jgi:hypothetical protein
MAYLTFVGPEQWRGRGRPKTKPSQEVIDALQQTSRQGPIAQVRLESERGTRARVSEVAQCRRELNAAAGVLGVQVRTQEKDDVLLFFQEPIRREDAS